MDTKGALEKIKEAETKTQGALEQAKKESQKIMHDALLEKERIIKNSQQRARLDAQQLKTKIEEETFGEIKTIANQAKEDIRVLQEKAEDNLVRAVEFLKGKISV